MLVVGERLPSSVLYAVRLAWPGYVLVNDAVISVVCCAAQPDPVVLLVQVGPDIRLRLGNYIAADQRAGMGQLHAPKVES